MRSCTCGTSLPPLANFCPTCGQGVAVVVGRERFAQLDAEETTPRERRGPSHPAPGSHPGGVSPVGGRGSRGPAAESRAAVPPETAPRRATVPDPMGRRPSPALVSSGPTGAGAPLPVTVDDEISWPSSDPAGRGRAYRAMQARLVQDAQMATVPLVTESLGGQVRHGMARLGALALIVLRMVLFFAVIMAVAFGLSLWFNPQ